MQEKCSIYGHLDSVYQRYDLLRLTLGHQAVKQSPLLPASLDAQSNEDAVHHSVSFNTGEFMFIFVACPPSVMLCSASCIFQKLLVREAE